MLSSWRNLNASGGGTADNPVTHAMSAAVAASGRPFPSPGCLRHHVVQWSSVGLVRVPLGAASFRRSRDVGSVATWQVESVAGRSRSGGGGNLCRTPITPIISATLAVQRVANAHEIRQHGADAVAIGADVFPPERVVDTERLYQSGEIDIVVGTARLDIIDQAISDATEEQFDRLLAGDT